MNDLLEQDYERYNNNSTNDYLEIALAFLREYNDIVESIKRRNGMYFNGCGRRALDLLKDLKHAGIEGKILLILPPYNSTLTHESGTLWRYHFVVEYNGLVFDPSYTGRMAIPLEEYINTAFEYPKEGIIVREFSERMLLS